MTVKYILIITIWSLSLSGSAQSIFPNFLKGTWKVENKDIYEHWDSLNKNTLKGFSYNIIDDVMTISEYLEISRIDTEIVYTATVLNQNQGQGVKFVLTNSDSAFTFENPGHDFPKKIIYQQKTKTEILVRVSDGKLGGFEYLMKKQAEKSIMKDSTVSNPNYDDKLAKKLESDDYGMKSYVLVILSTGPNLTSDTSFINSSFRGHLDNMDRLVKEGKLIVAGPIGKNTNQYRGIFILKGTSMEQAETLLQTDPAIKERLLNAELYNWYGSAALPEYLKYADKIWKTKPF